MDEQTATKLLKEIPIPYEEALRQDRTTADLVLCSLRWGYDIGLGFKYQVKGLAKESGDAIHMAYLMWKALHK